MRTLFLLSALAACSERDANDPSPAWAPDRVVPTTRGVAVPLAVTGKVALVSADGDVAAIDLAPAVITDVHPVPGGDALALRTVTHQCADAKARVLSDCATEDYSAVHELVVWDDGVQARVALPSWFGELRLSADGRFATALIDPEATTGTYGLINLNALAVIDLTTGASWEVTVGFGATDLLYLAPQGATTSALVLADGEVDLVDLTGQLPDPDVIYPLTLDADVDVRAQGVTTTPDGAYAILGTGGADLYVLDLQRPSINIVGLPDVAARLVPDPARDRTLIAYRTQRELGVLWHDRFELEGLLLEEPISELDVRGDLALGWSRSGYLDAVRVDLTTDTVDEYRLHYPAREVLLDPQGRMALSLANASPPRVEVLNLQPVAGGRLDTDPRPFALPASPIGAWLSPTDDGVDAWILQDGDTNLLTLAWPALSAGQIELPARAVALDVLPDGALFATHDDATGALTFLDGDGVMTTVTGFATAGVLDSTPFETVTEDE